MTSQPSRCPHGITDDPTPANHIRCGSYGVLCDLCREDRADARTDRLVEGLALAGLLANPSFTDGNGASGPGVANLSVDLADALRREREGGDDEQE